MKTVWKYTLGVEEHQYLNMPCDAQVVHVGEQHGDLCIWALVDTEQPKEDRFFHVFGTGHPMTMDATSRFAGKEYQYLGTGMLQGGSLVLHVFKQDWS